MSVEMNRNTPLAEETVLSKIESDSSSAVACGISEPRFKDESVTNDDEEDNAKAERTRLGLFIFSALYTIYAGAFYGWGPMKLMLEENGAFASRCEKSAEVVTSPTGWAGAICDKQTASLLNVQLIAQITMIFSPVLGEINDRFGPPTLMNILGLSGVLGLTLLTISSALSMDGLLYPALLFMGFMAVASSVIGVPTGMIFAGRGQSRTISALNALFDAGSATYLALWAIKGATGASLTAIVGGYTTLAAFCFGGAMYLWRIVTPADDVADGNICRKETAALEMEGTVPPCDSQSNQAGAVTTNVHGNDNSQASANNNQNADECDPLPMEIEDRFEQNPNLTFKGDRTYIPIAQRPPMKQLQSSQFVLVATFFAIQVAKNIFTLTTARDFLAYLGDDETGHKYLTIFTLLMPASIAGLPFVDCAIHRYGYYGGLQAINILSLSHGIIQVSSENLDVQIVGFIIFSFFRCFLFSVVFSFIPSFLSGNVVGKAAGVLHLSAGICSFLNIPLANLAVKQLKGNFFIPNLVYTVLVLPSIFLAWKIRAGIAREKASLLE